MHVCMYFMYLRTNVLYVQGEYKDNKKNGKGVYKYISGVLYEGEFKDNKKNGQGYIRYAGGDHYTGTNRY